MNRMFAAISALLLAAPMAHAATQVIDSNNVLIGATGVQFGGATYNVSFQEGSCASLYNGCDDSAITFSSMDQAVLAAVALFEQVLPFGNFYNSNPGQIAFCAPGTAACLSRVVFDNADPNNGSHVAVQNGNNVVEFDDVFLETLPFDDNTIGQDNVNYASFTLTTMPLPAAGWLLLGGIAGLFGLKARRS